MWTKALGMAVLMLVVNTVFMQPSLGAPYPTKSVEVLCPYNPGSNMDILARVVAEVARKYLRQPLVINNKPGAGGTVAAADIIKSPPDGYRILTLTSSYFVTTINSQKIPFDPNHLAPIANFTVYREGMIVKGDSPWKTFGDLLEYGKKNPGKLRWSHPIKASPLHMNPLLIFRKAGVNAIEVPYTGAAEELAAVLGGHLDAASLTYAGFKEHVESGSIKYLIFYGDQRYSALPKVPCALELDFPEAARLQTFVGAYAHKNTPEEVKKTLLDAFRRTCEDREFQERCEKLGIEIRFGGPEFIREEIRKCAEVAIPLLKELGLYVGK